MTPVLDAICSCDTCNFIAPPLKLAEGNISKRTIRNYLASIGWSSVELDGRWWDHCPECKSRKAEKAVA